MIWDIKCKKNAEIQVGQSLFQSHEGVSLLLFWGEFVGSHDPSIRPRRNGVMRGWIKEPHKSFPHAAPALTPQSKVVVVVKQMCFRLISTIVSDARAWEQEAIQRATLTKQRADVWNTKTSSFTHKQDKTQSARLSFHPQTAKHDMHVSLFH